MATSYSEEGRKKSKEVGATATPYSYSLKKCFAYLLAFKEFIAVKSKKVKVEKPKLDAAYVNFAFEINGCVAFIEIVIHNHFVLPMSLFIDLMFCFPNREASSKLLAVLRDCNAVYIGETGQSLETRKREHIDAFKNFDQKKSALCQHVSRK